MVLFYHSLCGVTLTAIVIVMKRLISGDPFVFYTWDQYKMIFLCCFCDFTCVGCQVLAFQNDTSGFVALVGYISIVYAFCADYFIFHEQMAALAIVGASLIFVVTIISSVLKILDTRKYKREQLEKAKTEET